MKILFVLLTLSLGSQAQVIQLNDSLEITNACICWQTDSFYLEVECDSITAYLTRGKHWNGVDTIMLQKARLDINSFHKNYYKLASNYQEKFLLEVMTTRFYWDRQLIIKNLISHSKENHIDAIPYYDVGTSGYNIYIRDNFIFRSIELVY